MKKKGIVPKWARFKKRLAFAIMAFKQYDHLLFGLVYSTEYCGANPYGDEEMVASKFRIRFFDKECMARTLPLRPVRCEHGGDAPGQFPNRGAWKDRGFIVGSVSVQEQMAKSAYEHLQ